MAANSPIAEVETAIEHLKADRGESAAAILRPRLDDGDVRVLHATAAALARNRQFAWARLFVERALTLAPDNAQLLLTASNLAGDLGHTAEAVEMAKRAAQAGPQLAEAHNNLGVLLIAAGQLPEAVDAFRRAVDVKPGYARAWVNLAAAQLRVGREAEALDAANRAASLDASNALALQIKGNALVVAGDMQGAESALRGALQRDPSNVEACLLLTSLLTRKRRVDVCVVLLRQALAHSPSSAILWGQLGDACAELDQESAAAQAYTRAMQLAPGDLAWPIRLATLLPRIPSSQAHIDSVRERYSQGLDALLAREFSLTGSDAATQLNIAFQTPFYLGYQGCDDKVLQRKYADLAARAVKQVFPEHFGARTKQARGPRLRIRIGFASRYLYSCTAGHYFASWILGLPQERFDVSIYTSGLVRDALATSFEKRALSTFRKDATIGEFAGRIAADELDILVYPELGMDQVFYQLATMRLAPVQLAAWGHPVTPGHRNLDGYVSCETMEPPDAQSHYNEPLHLLPGIGTRYVMPDSPDVNSTRGDFQLPADKVLMLVPQSLFKIHPDNDAIVVDILRRAPSVVAVMFAGQNNAITQKFVQRLLRAFETARVPHQGRIKILPVVDHAAYRRINALCDFMLDTLHWSGGNASLDALAQGLPLVTLPGEFMRGRQSMAMLRILGVEELIAKERAGFIDMAVRLSADAGRRGQLRARILAARHKLFDDPKPVEALAALLERLHGKGMPGAAQDTSANR
ncbi:MAG: tetratricopeptide repeat protein [Betaproteobacteria bacterium]|nr:tetratricopeptide repeat protein [Betaproteobacteria bacterium]